MDKQILEIATLLSSAKRAKPVISNLDFFKLLSKTIDNAFQKLELSEASVDIRSAAGTLDIPYNSSPDVCTAIGTCIATYWSKTNQSNLGIPKYNTIVLITNNSARIANRIEKDLRKLRKKTGNPEYYDLLEVIFRHVRTITWRVLEIDNESRPDTYPVRIVN